MDTREIASEYRQSHWARVLQERSTSGQSVREYCKTAGIGENVYYYWQRKLRAAACKELAASVEKGNIDLSHVPSGWAIAVESTRSGKPIVIEVSGCRVYAERDTDPEQLRAVCRILRSLC